VRLHFKIGTARDLLVRNTDNERVMVDEGADTVERASSPDQMLSTGDAQPVSRTPPSYFPAQK
jgi:hypothetical protein